MMNEQRRLLVVSGPSGVGKDSVVKAMIRKYAQADELIEVSVSATTRSKALGEAEGVDYHFLERRQFEEHIAADSFLEYAEYSENYYGTLKAEVDSRISRGITCVLVIEVRGAERVKSAYPECTTVFVLPPDMKELESRIRGRKRDSEEQIHQRMETAKLLEMPLADSYDFKIVNTDLDTCADELYAILKQRQQAE